MASTVCMFWEKYEAIKVNQKKICIKIQVITKATAMITASSGFTLMPRVSSSKNLSRPALWAGMGDFFSRFFSLLLLMVVVSLALFYTS